MYEEFYLMSSHVYVRIRTEAQCNRYVSFENVYVFTFTFLAWFRDMISTKAIHKVANSSHLGYLFYLYLTIIRKCFTFGMPKFPRRKIWSMKKGNLRENLGAKRKWIPSPVKLAKTPLFYQVYPGALNRNFSFLGLPAESIPCRMKGAVNVKGCEEDLNF